MKPPIWRAIMGASALILFAMASFLFFNPMAIHAFTDMPPEANACLLSDARARAGLLLLSAIMLASGAASPGFTSTAIWLNVQLFAAYGLARVSGITVTTAPSNASTNPTAIDVAISLVDAAIVMVTRDQPSFL